MTADKSTVRLLLLLLLLVVVMVVVVVDVRILVPRFYILFSVVVAVATLFTVVSAIIVVGVCDYSFF